MFLRHLFEQMDKIRKIPKSPQLSGSGELEEGYEIIGVLPEELRKLYMLRMEVAQMYKELVQTQMQSSFQSLVRGEFSSMGDMDSPQLCAARAEVELLDMIFWQEVRFAFPQTINRGSVSLHAEWKLAWCAEPEPQGSPRDLLHALMQLD